MRLVWRLWTMDLWKNLVFFSPSFSHWMRDFCLQSTSSCALLSAIWLFRSVSCVFRSSVRPLCSGSVVVVFAFVVLDAPVLGRYCQRWTYSRILRCCLRFFSLCWNLIHRGSCLDGRLLPPCLDVCLEIWVCQPEFFKAERFSAWGASDVEG
jgi:hypothetical protein